MTQRAVARECADWISRKAVFKSNITGENMGGFMTVDSLKEQTAYMPLNGFTTVDIGCERGNNSYNLVNRMEAPFSTQYMQLFDTLWNDRVKMQDVTEMIISSISTAYRENSPEFIYFMMLYHVFSEFLNDISEDVLPNEATGFKQSKIWSMLYDFQRDAVCQRRFKIVGKRLRNFVVFRRGGVTKIKRFLAEKEYSRFAAFGA